MVQKRKSGGFFRGAAGRDRADEELAKQKARAEARKEQGNMPFRFRVAVGETTQFVVLDDEPDFFRHEYPRLQPVASGQAASLRRAGRAGPAGPRSRLSPRLRAAWSRSRRNPQDRAGSIASRFTHFTSAS